MGDTMGQMAEDAINGFSCSWCGTYFKKEHGYPVACKDCWDDALDRYGDDETQTNATGVQRATIDEL